jgi:transposase
MYVYHVSLSYPEVETLEQMYQHAPKRRLRQRAHMILLSSKGYCQKEVATIIGVSYPTARHPYVCHLWVSRPLQPRHTGGPAQLSAAQRKQMDLWLSDSPRVWGYNQSNWTARLMRYHLKRTWGLELSEETVRRWIHRLGYTRVRPRYKNQRVDEVEKKRRKRPQ